MCVCHSLAVKILIFRQGSRHFKSFVCLLMRMALGCQDAPSLGSYLSRCLIFRQGSRFQSCMCVFVNAYGSWLSRCSIFRQLTCQDVSSLGRGVVFSVFVNVYGSWLSRCSIFRQLTCQDVSSLGRGVVFSRACVCFLMCMALGCQDAPSLGSYLSRCLIFRQGSRFQSCMCVFVNVYGSWLSRCSIFRQLPVKMSHL